MTKTVICLAATVRTAGAIGADAIGDLFLTMLQWQSVDPSLLVRRDGVPTSPSVLPIRPDGSRPAFHVRARTSPLGLTTHHTTSPVPPCHRRTDG